MTRIEPYAVDTARSARLNDQIVAVAAVAVAKWLRLAAAPAFAIMALLTALYASSMDPLCSSAHVAPLSGMTPMYLLMSAFQSPPWLNLIFGRSSVLGNRERAASPMERKTVLGHR